MTWVLAGLAALAVAALCSWIHYRLVRYGPTWSVVEDEEERRWQ